MGTALFFAKAWSGGQRQERLELCGTHIQLIPFHARMHAHTHSRTERVREKQAVLTNTGCRGGQSRPDDSQHTLINKMAVNRNLVDTVHYYNTTLWFQPFLLLLNLQLFQLTH